MATDDTFEPKNISSSCVFYLVAAFLGGLALVVLAWFFIARDDPEAVPDGEGPIEAAEPPGD